MECSLPPPLSEEKLSAALDGTAAPSVRRHLARCPGCSARLAEARRVENALAGRLARWDCPSAQQLGDYHLGLLDEADVRDMARHLAECARCTMELEELRAFLAADADVSAQLASQAAAAPRAVLAGAGRRLGELLARIVPPSPEVALRGAADAPIVADAGGTLLVLRTRPAANGQLALTGQVAADDQDRWSGALLTLRQAGEVRLIITLDENGGFTCDSLPPGPTEIRITPERGPALLLPEVDLR